MEEREDNMIYENGTGRQPTQEEQSVIDQNLWGGYETKADAIVSQVKGKEITINDSAASVMPSIKIMGASVQDGTPSIDNPVDIEDVTSESIEVTNGSDVQEASLDWTLRGIPVSSGGNYTDGNGQQWICDSIERYADGSGKYIQRVASFTFNGTENWEESPTEGSNFRLRLLIPRTILPADSDVKNNQSLMSCLPLGNNGSTYRFPNIYTIVNITNTQVVIYCTPQQNNVAMTSEQWKAYLSNNNATMLAVLITPIETPLTAEQVNELALDTYYPTTSISSNADVVIEYIADTKNYITNLQN